MPRLHIVFNFRIFNLEQKRPLLCLWIILLSHTITRPSNFDSFSEIDFALVRLGLSRGVLCLASGALGEIGLVTLALSVGQVIALVVVQSETKLALVAAEVIAHKVGIFRQIDRLQRQSPEPLTPVDGFVLGGGRTSASRFRTPFSIHLSDVQDHKSGKGKENQTY